MGVTWRRRAGRRGFQVRARAKGYHFEKTVQSEAERDTLVDELRALLAEREARDFGPSPTVPNACWRWLDLYESTLKPYWAKNARSIITNHIEPHLGEVLLRTLTEDRLRQYVADRAREESPPSPYVLRNALKIIARAARTAPTGTRPLEALPKVGDLVRIPRAPKPAWIAPELRAILALSWREGLEWAAFFHVLAATAVRRGEAMGMQWEHVNHAKGEIALWQAIVDDQVVELKDADPRPVPMVPELSELLRELHELRRRQGLERGWPEVPRWVFCRPDGAPLSVDDVVTVWRRLRRQFAAEDVRPFKMHAFRHTWASLALEAGESIAYVAQVLGHGSPGYTLATYAHALPREARDLQTFRGLFSSRTLHTAWVQDREK